MRFQGVDFYFGSSGGTNISKIKYPFDYIERGDVQLHAEGLIAQFWSILTKVELSEHRKIVFANSAKIIFDVSTLRFCHGSIFQDRPNLLIYVVDICVSFLQNF